MGRLSISCLVPASWHFSLSATGFPRLLNPTFRQLMVIGAAAVILLLLIYSLLMARSKHGGSYLDIKYQRYLARVTDMDATDTSNPNINYGIVVDCGSSGSRIFVYCWPRHNGNPHELLDIKQMRDQNRKTVVMKIKPGISELSSTPEKASDYISPLLDFAARHIPKDKHKETPLYILCTAGLRVLTESQQEAILEDLRTDIPVRYDFLFSDSHTEVISGKQEGVYAWIGINFVLGRFDHIEEEDDAVVEVNVPGADNKEAILRKRTAGILDMGGVSTQIAYEVPKSVSFASSQQEEVAKNLLAEFNLGCDAHETQHVYRVYVATFLGFGGNAARQRYEDHIFSSNMEKNRLLGKQIGMSGDAPYLDPCLPLDISDQIQQRGQTMYLRGTGDFQLCRQIIQPLMNLSNETQTTLNGVYQPPVPYHNSEFYGFSEFYYCTHSYVFSIDKVQLRASPSVTLRNGDNLSLTCFVQFIKGETESFELTTQFAFFKNFKQIYNVSSNSPNATYRLSPARVSSSGQYQCKVHVGQMMKQSGIVTITVTGLSKPKLSVSTNSTKEGQTIIVKCEAPEEEPPFRFTFYKMKNNGNKDMEVLGPIPTSENPASMEVSMAEGDRIVRFLCDVALTSLPNSNVSDLSDWMLVTVEQQFSTPRIEVSPSLNFTEGKEMSVKCSIQTSSSVSGKVQLFIQNGTHILTSSKTDTVWYAQRATESHSGQYICKAEYEQTSKSNSTNVTVTELFKSPSLYSNIRNSTMDEDARLSLSCSVQGISPSSAHNFSLLKDGQIRSNSEKLEIYAKTSDSGTYRCMVTISNITKTSGDLPIRVYAPVSKPLLSHRNQSTSMAVQGSTIELRCKCDKGTPPITYSLMKGSMVLSNITETEAKAAMFKLNISEQQNSGQYRCRAYNLHSSSLGFSNTVNITVISPITEVTLTTIPQSGTVEEGKELSLVCAVKNGSLPIDFHFLVKRGKESVLHSSMDKSVFHSETQIKSFSANDDGSYFCRATNGAHQTVDSNLVHVKAVLATWKKGLIITFVVFILIAAVAICSYFYTERKKKGRETALDMNRTTNEKSSSKEKSAAIGLKSEEESCLVPGNVVQSEDENHVDKSPEGNLGNNKEKPEVEPVTPNPHQDGSEATPREQKMSKCPSEDV